MYWKDFFNRLQLCSPTLYNFAFADAGLLFVAETMYSPCAIGITPDVDTQAVSNTAKIAEKSKLIFII